MRDDEKKKPPTKKLLLAKETLRALDLEQVSGARIKIPTDVTYSHQAACPHASYYGRC